MGLKRTPAGVLIYITAFGPHNSASNVWGGGCCGGGYCRWAEQFAITSKPRKTEIYRTMNDVVKVDFD